MYSTAVPFTHRHHTSTGFHRFTGECNHPDSRLRSCQELGSQFLFANQKFTMKYGQCKGMDPTSQTDPLLLQDDINQVSDSDPALRSTP